MKIMISHFGNLDGGGFGRTFAIAMNFCKLNFETILLTSTHNLRFFPFRIILRNNVKIIVFYEILPDKYINLGYGIFSLINKCFFSVIIKFDIVFSDTGHRPLSGWPCLVNKYLYSAIYIAEWWDVFNISIFPEDGILKKISKKLDKVNEIKHRKKADGIIVLSSYLKERAISLGFIEKNIEIVHGGADVDRIKFRNSGDIKLKNGFKSNSIVFGFVGITDVDIDDIESFFYAFNEINNHNLEIFTTGKGLSENTICKFNLFNNLHQLGWINYSNSSETLSCADILVLLKKPTYQNIMGWPNKLGDYFAIGRPIMITPYGDISTYVKKHPEIFIVCENEIMSVKKAILYCIENINYLKTLNGYIRNLAVNNYSWFERVKKIENFCEKIRRERKNV